MTYKCTGMCRRTGMTVKECGGSFYAEKCPYCLGRIQPEQAEALPEPVSDTTTAREKAWLRAVLTDAVESKKAWPSGRKII